MPISEKDARRKYLKYLLSQYEKGVLQQDKIELLKKEGFITAPPVGKEKVNSIVYMEKRW
jgi:hypothetical protein